MIKVDVNHVKDKEGREYIIGFDITGHADEGVCLAISSTSQMVLNCLLANTNCTIFEKEEKGITFFHLETNEHIELIEVQMLMKALKAFLLDLEFSFPKQLAVVLSTKGGYYGIS
jgi:uncharacterized protein YsxB (DUF464 family)